MRQTETNDHILRAKIHSLYNATIILMNAFLAVLVHLSPQPLEVLLELKKQYMELLLEGGQFSKHTVANLLHPIRKKQPDFLKSGEIMSATWSHGDL